MEILLLEVSEKEVVYWALHMGVAKVPVGNNDDADTLHPCNRGFVLFRELPMAPAAKSGQ